MDGHFTTCSEWVKIVYPKIVYQTLETLFGKLDSFGKEYSNEQTLSKNLAIFDIESICVQEESFKDTNRTKWIRERTLIRVSVSSNLVKELILSCNSETHHLVTSFIGTLENLALQREAAMRDLFFDIKTTIKIERGNILEKLTQLRSQTEQADLDNCDYETCNSFQILQNPKKQLIHLQNIWNVNAMFYLCLVSTTPNMI